MSYSPPVATLLSLGRPSPSRDRWPDYLALGLADEHVPTLIQLITDPALAWEHKQEGQDEAPFWAPIHAWRALGQLRAADAVGPLLEVLHREVESDWTTEQVPVVLGMIGPPAMGPVRSALVRAAGEPEPWEATALASALEKIARGHPEARGDVVAALSAQLEAWPEQDSSLNAFLISYLVDLQAVEAAPLMEAAYAADAVDTSVHGDWEDIRMDLGMLPARTRPRSPSPLMELLTRPLPPGRRDPAPPPPPNPAARARSLRKAQKKASKGKRGK